MTDDFEIAEKKRKRNKMIRALCIGGIAGFVGAFGMMQLAGSGMLGELGGSREIALLIAVIYLIIAGILAFGLVSPEAGAKFLNVEDADELEEQRVQLTYGTGGMAAIGLALIVAALAAPAGPIPPTIAVISFVLLIGFCWFTGIRQRNQVDELMRSISVECGSVAFYCIALFGGGWAFLAHLEYVPGPQMLDWLSMLAAFLLLSAFIVTGKRGMMEQR